MLTRGQELLRQVRSGYAPPPALTVSEFADREIVVTAGPLAGTHWRTSLAPYQAGIMNVFHEAGVQTAVVMGSSQWGKTATATNVVAYHIKHDPCSILVVEPTVDPMAKDFATNRLEPVIAASPALREVAGNKRAKDKRNTTLEKSGPGWSLVIGGANSAASLAARSVRLLVLDEIDRYPAELPGEGSTIAIAIKRTQTFRRRKRILMLSSPTLKGAAIDSWFKKGDQRRFYVPCPDCGHKHAYKWANVHWDKATNDPATAYLQCPACEYHISDAERVAALQEGEWIAENPGRRDKSIVSFHLWEAYSPFSSLAEIVAGFLSAYEKKKAGDPAEMHTWQNTTLGEAIEPNQAELIEPHILLQRREEGFGAARRDPAHAGEVLDGPDEIEIPAGACCLTMGVDTQDSRLELVVYAWGPGEESWLVDRRIIPGDPARPEPWKMLDTVLDTRYRHASGHELLIQATCIDTAGHRTNFVYDYVAKREARKVYAIIGRSGQMPIVSSPSERKYGAQGRQVPLYTLGVDAAKSMFMTRLKLTERGAGYVHIPYMDLVDDEFAAQLVSEALIMKWDHGLPVQVWRKLRPRNEGLDCTVYAIGALRLLNPRLPQMMQALQALAPIRGTAAVARRRPRPRTGPSEYLQQ